MVEDGYGKYEQFVKAEPFLIVEWHDPETEAVGWLVINSLTGRAAGGGTRMHKDATEEECKFLAKTMQIKFRVANPRIGGAKSVIRFDHKDERKQEVLRRWFESVSPYVRLFYGSGGDLNVKELEEVIPQFRKLNINHPQKGIVVGHYLHKLVIGERRDDGGAGDGGERLEDLCERRLTQLLEGGENTVELEGCPEPFKVAQLVTGYGLHKALNYFYEARGNHLAGKRIIIEGFGEVGGPAAYYLERAGAKIVGVVAKLGESYGWAVNNSGLDVAQLLAVREKGDLPSGHPACKYGADPAEFWATSADVFVPAANSHLTNLETLDKLRSAGISVIACGANNPFGPKPYAPANRSPASGAPPKDGAPPADGIAKLLTTMRQADRDFAVVPDFIANCGTARMFSYLMEDDRDSITADAILESVDQTIRENMEKLMSGFGESHGLLNRAYSIFLD